MIEVLKAVDEGKTIMFKPKRLPAAVWAVCEKPSWNFGDNDYKVKPEPKLRPYKNAEEFLQAGKEHGPYIKQPDPGTKRYLNPVMVFDDRVIFWFGSVPAVNYYYDQILEFKWQDGTPCGILEE